ncbi:MAG: rhomboid family intramembrane serine protease [Candidatus Melainabacteria bacterium]|nr:rhomboid family intramembrane serine protease [Candidatus Melainabacteria bacterium]
MKTDHSKIKSASSAIALTIILCFLFELPHLEQGLLFPINGDALATMGANFGPLTVLKNEYWRLLTFGFLHSNLLHLMLNVYALVEFGPLAESLLGKKKYLFIYVFSGITGGLASIAFDPLRTSVGASASICGALGAFICVSWFKSFKSTKNDSSDAKTEKNKLSRAELVVLLVFLAYSLLLGTTSSSTDNAAHLGGFLTGAIAAVLLTRKKWDSYVALFLLCAGLTFVDIKRLENNPVVTEYLLRQEGAKLASNKQYLESISKFDQALSVIPDEPYALQGRGEALMKLEKNEEAKKDFDTILLKDPKHKGALFDRSIALMHLGRYQEGLVDVDNLVSIDSSHSMVYNNRAWFRLNDFNNKNSLQLAMKDTEKALALDKRNLAAYDTKGTIYLMLGDYTNARANFEKCAKVKETSGAANFHLAVLELVQGNKVEAQKRFAEYRAGEYKPDDFELKFCREKFGITDLDKKDKT